MHAVINIRSMHTWVAVISKTNFIADCVRGVKCINFRALTVRATFSAVARIYWDVEADGGQIVRLDRRNLLLCSIMGVFELVPVWYGGFSIIAG